MPVGIGKGFATSAAISLASALSKYSNYHSAIAKAHNAEVVLKTGLGDVMAIAYGKGIALRVKGGGPGWGKVYSIIESDKFKKVSVIALEFKGSWKDTPSMLSSIKSYFPFPPLWRRLLTNPSLETFLNVANAFSKTLGMYPEEFSFIESLKGVLGTYAKKSVYLTVVKNIHIRAVLDKLRKEGLDPQIFTISENGIGGL
ncbi:hypothetical protein IPA_05000 [Ignicoccus pacificus DSM 13166]|uniref:Pantoate kinase n=1 Tax=Ignicoccus pacificus DSM 13166 TaxID=940294 RepID=A0A977KCS3_9CREN|nr:hypothetical protein IPA_05000 [Ignicoccus pacificus DSM 13166]